MIAEPDHRRTVAFAVIGAAVAMALAAVRPLVLVVIRRRGVTVMIIAPMMRLILAVMRLILVAVTALVLAATGS